MPYTNWDLKYLMCMCGKPFVVKLQTVILRDTVRRNRGVNKLLLALQVPVSNLDLETAYHD